MSLILKYYGLMSVLRPTVDQLPALPAPPPYPSPFFHGQLCFDLERGNPEGPWVPDDEVNEETMCKFCAYTNNMVQCKKKVLNQHKPHLYCMDLKLGRCWKEGLIVSMKCSDTMWVDRFILRTGFPSGTGAGVLKIWGNNDAAGWCMGRVNAGAMPPTFGGQVTYLNNECYRFLRLTPSGVSTWIGPNFNNSGTGGRRRLIKGESPPTKFGMASRAKVMAAGGDSGDCSRGPPCTCNSCSAKEMTACCGPAKADLQAEKMQAVGISKELQKKLDLESKGLEKELRWMAHQGKDSNWLPLEKTQAPFRGFELPPRTAASPYSVTKVMEEELLAGLERIMVAIEMDKKYSGGASIAKLEKKLQIDLSQFRLMDVYKNSGVVDVGEMTCKMCQMKKG